MALVFQPGGITSDARDLFVDGADSHHKHLMFAIDLTLARGLLDISPTCQAVPAMDRWRARLKEACENAYSRQTSRTHGATYSVAESDFQPGAIPAPVVAQITAPIVGTAKAPSPRDIFPVSVFGSLRLGQPA